jgi:hypothetical protein
LLIDLQKAHAAAAPSGLFGTVSPAAAANLKSAQTGIVAAYPTGDDIKSVVSTIMTAAEKNPAIMKANSVQDIANQIGLDYNQLTPEEQQDVEELFSVVRGHF